MAKLPEPDITRVRRWCEQRVPEHARDQVRMECDAGARHLTIVECRPPWREGTGPEWTRFPIARLRYNAGNQDMVVVPARPESPLPPLQPAPAITARR